MNQPNCCSQCYGMGDCGRTKRDCDCHTTSASTEPKDSWETRFDKEFLYKPGEPFECLTGDAAIHPHKVKSFISSLLAEARKETAGIGQEITAEVAKQTSIAAYEQGRKSTVEEMLTWAKDHYWDSLDKSLVLLHLKAFLSTESTSK